MIEYLGRSKEMSEKLEESKDKCEPIFMAIREYAINVSHNPIEKERQARSALHGPEMVFVGICYQNESHNPIEKEKKISYFKTYV